MALAKSKIAPAIFWIGFLALGFVSSFAEPGKQHKALASGKQQPAVDALLAETDNRPAPKPSLARQN
ncbi:hypothetical protein [Methylocystis iwaonis]|uniref:Uncharacterized protein n=1 Tax=Methylocystis iwaonis TaxID=2885079 RepID=A0ABM8EAB7_9HYPH|nr:hypothetical protein [Methylocystis iwaonis]BDV34947.1 hypothetical protein SS37A_24760 [Methylocystis iwaonis]